MRRLAWKVQFMPLGSEGLFRLFLTYFGFTEDEVTPFKLRLMGFKGLTPGDFGVLWKRYQFEGLHDVSPEQVLNDLESEFSYRSVGLSIGFKAS